MSEMQYTTEIRIPSQSYKLFKEGRQRFPVSAVKRLIKRAREGNKFANDELFQIYGGKIRHIANKYYDAFKDDFAFSVVDLEQEGFLVLQDLIKNYDFNWKVGFNLKLHNNIVAAIESFHLYGMQSPREEAWSVDIDLNQTLYASSGTKVSRSIATVDDVCEGQENASLNNMVSIEKILNNVNDEELSDSRAKEIIKLHYKDGETLKIIGEKIGLKGERVRQIEEQGIRDLSRSEYVQFIFDQYLDGGFTYAVHTKHKRDIKNNKELVNWAYGLVYDYASNAVISASLDNQLFFLARLIFGQIEIIKQQEESAAEEKKAKQTKEDRRIIAARRAILRSEDIA